MRGRRPTPAALKLLRGNPSRRPIRPTLEVTGDPPAAPGWLSAAEREAWETLVPELHARGIVRSSDSDVLALYVHTRCRWREASKELQRSGPTVHVRGCEKRSAWCILEKQLSDTLLRLSVELGMTPASRLRIGLPVQPAADGLSDFLKRRE